jgi:hypothetical protein
MRHARVLRGALERGTIVEPSEKGVVVLVRSPLARVLIGVSAVAFAVLLVLSAVIGVAIVRDVIPQIETVGFADLELGHLLGTSWAANAALLAGVTAATAALVVVRRSRRP